jgi:FdhD protein
MTWRDPAVDEWPVTAIRDGAREAITDPVAVEEPLEIRIASGDGIPPTPLTVTMRTPGHDVELVAGLLYTEGLVSDREDLLAVRDAVDPDRRLDNRIDVQFRDGFELDPERTARSFISTAACGVCGKAAIDSVFVTGFPVRSDDGPRVARELLGQLPERMRSAQHVFARTGGLHAATLFDAHGELLVIREDVGRHNAVDKVIGARFLAGALPARDEILVVSGRAGFEIAQKALKAGIPILAAVGAPSSLSLRLAARAGMTVVGFLRDGRCNIYTAPDRVVG